jgi:predicted metal-dependent hydrolase
MAGFATPVASKPTARFPVRRPAFDFSRVEKLIYRDNALESSFWLVLQALFPDGERFFIDAVNDVRRKAEIDPQLARDIAAFMGQEAAHGRAHSAANEAIFTHHGVDLKTTERRTKALLGLISRVHTPMQRLAMTAGAEHFTATLARFMMRHREYLDGFRDPEVRRLIMWHSLEEREHRAVAFDLYRRAGGGYWLRAAMAPWFAAMIAPLIFYEVARLLASSGEWRDRSAMRRGLRSVFGRGGPLARMMPGLRDWFRRDFHPSDDDQSELEAAWRRELGLAG